VFKQKSREKKKKARDTELGPLKKLVSRSQKQSPKDTTNRPRPERRCLHAIVQNDR